jgi:hypothetical protein
MKSWLTTSVAIALAGCGGSKGEVGESPVDASAEAAAPDASDAGYDGEAGDGGPAAAYVRIAHWSPDAPAVDVCFVQGSSNFDGQVPRLGLPPDADAEADAGPAGLSFRYVTSYLALPPGSYGVRLVAAGAADCSTPVAGLDGVMLAAGAHTTIAAVGERMPAGNDQALKLVALPDDVSAPPGQIALRFVNADASAAASSVDFGTGTLSGAGGTYSGLVSGVPFGASSSVGTSDASAIDIHGYELGLPLSGATLSAHVTAAASDLATATSGVTVAAGSAASVVLLGGGSTKANLVLCADVDDGSGGPAQLAPCVAISP